MRALVLGGGISGLSAAYRLKRAGMQVEVLEAAPRVGGILATECFDGFEVELGPDSILSEKPWALSLARELGLGDKILRTCEDAHGAYVVSDGALVRVPAGFSMMAPSDLRAFARSPVLGALGKARALAELFVPRRTDLGDESLEDFVVRRLGRETFERLAQPLVGGIYGADPKQLSLAATMPRFIQLERDYGSLIRGLRAKRKASGHGAAREAGARYGMFAAFQGGMQTLVDGLAHALKADIRLQHAVTRVSRAHGVYNVETSHGSKLADAVVLALPTHVAAPLLAQLDPVLSSALAEIRYASAATVTCSWDIAAIPRALDAYGFVVPARENREIIAATWASAKWPGRAPAGKALLRVFIGGYTGQALVERDDSALLSIALRELGALMGIARAPDWSRVVRYRNAMPQYHVGHAQRVARIDAAAQRHEGLALAGNAYRGVGIPDAVKSGEDAAALVLSQRAALEKSPAA